MRGFLETEYVEIMMKVMRDCLEDEDAFTTARRLGLPMQPCSKCGDDPHAIDAPHWADVTSYLFGIAVGQAMAKSGE